MAKAGDKLVLPIGAVVARKLEPGVETRAVARDAIPPGWAVYDIDPGDRARLRPAHRAGRYGGVERADGRVRDAAVRPWHAGGGAGHGRRHRRRAP